MCPCCSRLCFYSVLEAGAEISRRRIDNIAFRVTEHCDDSMVQVGGLPVQYRDL